MPTAEDSVVLVQRGAVITKITAPTHRASELQYPFVALNRNRVSLGTVFTGLQVNRKTAIRFHQRHGQFVNIGHNDRLRERKHDYFLSVFERVGSPASLRPAKNSRIRGIN